MYILILTLITQGGTVIYSTEFSNEKQCLEAASLWLDVVSNQHTIDKEAICIKK